MKNKPELNEKWIKASIIGTIWAASEIVLGSFLHNLKVPFSGNILTAIGIITLISISYIWTEKGLFWRAGLICALMKTMSPSAVIFGPMIAIISEAFLLEISVRVFGKSYFGYILGAMLAMSWNLFHKIINIIIFYGFDMVELYKNLLKFVGKQLNIHFESIWLPIIVLLVIYCILGLISAIIGIRVGRKIKMQPAEYKATNVSNDNPENYGKPKTEFNYSLIWLAADLIFIIGALILQNYTSWLYWSLSITAITVLWAFRYKRAIRQLSKPKFWIYFVLITMITAFVFSSVESGTNGFVPGLLIGIQMNFRAVLIILGFSVLGTELYNPIIRNFFLRTWFKQLPLALELSFESLPSMIANIPDFKTIIKNPVSVIYQVVSQVEYRLSEIKSKMNRKIFILSGSVGAGKTTYIQKLIESLKIKKIPVGGIYSPRILENNVTIGYDLVDIKTNQREIFLRKFNNDVADRIGKYSISPNGLLFGLESISENKNRENKIVIIDEVGQLELDDKGWSSNIEKLVAAAHCHLLISVRDSLTEQVIKKWNLKVHSVYAVSDIDYLSVVNSIIEQIEEPY